MIFIIKSLAAASVLLTACVTGDPDPEYVNYVEPGDSVPSFTASGPHGTFTSPDGFTGKISVLVLFNTGCPHCDTEMPKIYELWKKIVDDPARQVVAIARDQTAEEVAADWPHGEMKYYTDPERYVFNKFADSYIPRIYIIDSGGVIRWMAVEKLLDEDGSPMSAARFEEIFMSYKL